MQLPANAFELAKADSFFELGYLLANPDVAKYVRKNGDGRVHFDTYGEREGRCQVTRTGYDAFLHTKFSKYSNAINLSTANFLNKKNSFPLTFGDRHFTIGEYQSESANAAYQPFTDAIRENPDKLFMDIGCGFRSEIFDNCLYVEVYPSSSADLIVEPDCYYPLKTESIDGIGCFCVLEHVTKPWIVVEEIHRMLKPGGRCYIDWPFLQPVHGYPSHYFNATASGMANLFSDAGFKVDSIVTERNQTPDWTVNWIIGKMIGDMPDNSVKNELLDMTVRDLIAMQPATGLWKEFTDAMTDESKSEFSAGNTMIATKTVAIKR